MSAQAVITAFQSLGEIEVGERLRQFVEHYRPLATALPCVKSFEEDSWDLRGKYFVAGAGNKKLSIRFLRLAVNQRYATELFEQPFLVFAKAYALHLMATKIWNSPSTLQRIYIPTLRYIEHGLRMARPSEAPCITALTEDVCEIANAAIRANDGSDIMKYNRCLCLNELAESLQDLGLCSRRFSWSGMAVVPQDTRYHVGADGDKLREEMLPSLEAIGAMAYCFEHAERPSEKWVSAINGLLSGQPARLGECWFLRPDWCVELEIQGHKQFGLRWWPRKKAKPLVKTFLLDDPFVPVFRQAIEWLLEISAPARKMATWYEKHPDMVYLPPELEHLRKKEFLTVAEAASLRGCQEELFLRKSSWARGKGLQLVLNPTTGNMGIRFADLEKAIVSDLPHGFPWYHRGKGLKHRDMLLLLREGEFNSVTPPSLTMFVESSDNTYYRALDSMVCRHGLVEADGSPVRIRSHQFRHILETTAYKAGVDRAWMNRWAGRARTSQEESYDDRTDAEKLAQSSGLSVRQRIFGALDSCEPNRPLSHTEIMIEVQVAKRAGYAHITDKGLCLHDYTEGPCRHFRDCLFCLDHRCIKGVPTWNSNIRAECAATEENLSNALEAERRGLFGVKEHIQNLLLPRALVCRDYQALLDSPERADGTEFRYISHGETYDPITNTLRNHAELGRKAGLDVAWVNRALEKISSIHVKCTQRPFLSDGGVA